MEYTILWVILFFGSDFGAKETIVREQPVFKEFE